MAAKEVVADREDEAEATRPLKRASSDGPVLLSGGVGLCLSLRIPSESNFSNSRHHSHLLISQAAAHIYCPIPRTGSIMPPSSFPRQHHQSKSITAAAALSFGDEGPVHSLTLSFHGSDQMDTSSNRQQQESSITNSNENQLQLLLSSVPTRSQSCRGVPLQPTPRWLVTGGCAVRRSGSQHLSPSAPSSWRPCKR